MSNDSIRDGSVTVFGCGLGGTNIAKSIKNSLGDMVGSTTIMNVSKQDLSRIDEKEFNIIDISTLLGESRKIDGTGKRREVASGIFKRCVLETDSFTTDIANTITPKTKIVFVCYSLGGGFGSGVGNLLVSLLNNPNLLFKNAKGEPNTEYLVFGVGILPNMKSGTETLLNSIYNLKEMRKLVENKTGSFFLVNNNNTDPESRSYIEELSKINSRVGDLFNRYLQLYGDGEFGNLDFSDRLRALEYSGLHCLCELNFTKNQNGRTVIKKTSPFFIPNNTKVKNLSYEVNKIHDGDIDRLETFNGLTYGGVARGFFDDGDLSNIAHFAGFTNISKVVEMYETRYDEIQNTIEDIDVNDTKTAHGFQDIDVKKEWLDDQVIVKGKAESLTDALDLD